MAFQTVCNMWSTLKYVLLRLDPDCVPYVLLSKYRKVMRSPSQAGGFPPVILVSSHTKTTRTQTSKTTLDANIEDHLGRKHRRPSGMQTSKTTLDANIEDNPGHKHRRPSVTQTSKTTLDSNINMTFRYNELFT